MSLPGGPGAGNTSLTVTGGGSTNTFANPYLLEIANANTYNGNTTINNATVSNYTTSGLSNPLPTGTVLNVINSGIFVQGGGVGGQTVAGLTGDSTALVGSANGGSAFTLTIAPANATSYTYAGVIGPVPLLGKAASATVNSLTIAGAGTGAEILTGTNTYAGATTLNSSTLGIDSVQAIGTGPFAINGGTIDNTAAVSNSITLSTNNVQTWGRAAGPPPISPTAAPAASTSAPAPSRSLVDAGTPFTETITANAGNTSTTLTVGGTISLAATATAGDTLAITGPGTVTLNGRITNGGGTGGSLALAMQGTGTLTLSGTANTYSGGTT